MVRQALRCDDLAVATDKLKRLASAIRKRRQEVGLTQEKVAFDSGVSVRNYARIEAGTVNVRVLTLYEVARVLGTTPGRLLDVTDETGRRDTRKR